MNNLLKFLGVDSVEFIACLLTILAFGSLCIGYYLVEREYDGLDKAREERKKERKRGNNV